PIGLHRRIVISDAGLLTSQDRGTDGHRDHRCEQPGACQIRHVTHCGPHARQEVWSSAIAAYAMIPTLDSARPMTSRLWRCPAALDRSLAASARSRLIRKIGTVTLIAISMPKSR